jgi:hypothetical protein
VASLAASNLILLAEMRTAAVSLHRRWTHWQAYRKALHAVDAK